jgi:hypothetical protein
MNNTATITKTSPQYFEALYAQADAAGRLAAEDAVPTPIVLGSETAPFNGVIDYSKPTYYVSEGLCGFAWVNFKGNTAFGRWAKKAGKADKAYGGGLQVWVSGFGQSVTRKSAYAQAFAAVLTEAGITAYAGSRLD